MRGFYLNTHSLPIQIALVQKTSLAKISFDIETHPGRNYPSTRRDSGSSKGRSVESFKMTNNHQNHGSLCRPTLAYHDVDRKDRVCLIRACTCNVRPCPGAGSRRRGPSRPPPPPPRRPRSGISTSPARTAAFQPRRSTTWCSGGSLPSYS